MEQSMELKRSQAEVDLAILYSSMRCVAVMFCV